MLKLTGKHFGCSEHISWQHNGIWPRLHFSGKRLMHMLRSTVIFHKMLHLKCLLEYSAEKYIILLFPPLHAILKYKSMPISALRFMPTPTKFTWQASCTRKEVLRRIDLNIHFRYVKLNLVFCFTF